MMRHVREIQKLVEDGQNKEAHEALDQLLGLGPQNIDALKLRSYLLSQEGKFQEEAYIWQKILTHDQEDEEAIDFFHRLHLEERENYYFTDFLPTGGRRFLAFPRMMFYSAVFGLLGCLLFLLLVGLSKRYPILNTPFFSLTFFGLLVILPWIAIITTYFRGLREVLVTKRGIVAASRLKSVSLIWEDIDKIYVIHNSQPGEKQIKLLVAPKDVENFSYIEIDITPETSALKARTFFLNEIKRFFKEPIYIDEKELHIKPRKIVSF